MKPDYARKVALRRILTNLGFTRQKDRVDRYGDTSEVFSGTFRDCAEPYPTRELWVKLRAAGNAFHSPVVVSHSVHVGESRPKQLTYNYSVETSLEMLAAIGHEKTRIDHVENVEGKTGGAALYAARQKARKRTKPMDRRVL